jgi:hypothetical protein
MEIRTEMGYVGEVTEIRPSIQELDAYVAVTRPVYGAGQPGRRPGRQLFKGR